MPKVVLDTNIFISAIIFGGKPREILKKALEGEFALFTSAPLLSELQGVLSEKFGYSFTQANEVERQMKLLAKVINTQNLEVKKIKEDPADNRVLEVALAGKVDFIVSGDKHLLKLKKFRKMPILSPSEFLSQLK